MTNASALSRWLTVAGSTVALTVGNGPLLLFTFGVFVKPITEQTGWARGQISLAVSIALTLAGLLTPVAGKLVDRWGVRRFLLLAVTSAAAGVAAISLTPGSVTGFVVLYAIAGAVSSGQSPLPYAKTISARFDTRRGLALGIAMAGSGLGAALMPQVATALLRTLQWREAYVALGAITWLVAFPAIFICIRDRPAKSRAEPVTQARGDEITIVLRGASFWIIAAAIFLAVTAVNGAIAHLAPLLSDRGLPSGMTGSALAAVGLSTIIGRLLSGYLLDRIFAPHLAAAIFLIPVVGFALLTMGGASPPAALVAAICFGACLGAEVDIVGYIVGRYFGLRRYGEIYGYVFAIFTIGSGLGPLLMGVSFDVTRSYNAALLAFAAMLLCSSLLMSRLRPYRYGAAHDDLATAQAL